jgi:hypothetical protein
MYSDGAVFSHQSTQPDTEWLPRVRDRDDFE